mmetsp:Transcript_123258/g.348278  ORF Transcript_123258/g.348278 Transcript_123258/m.348278 type:complete len:209 (+) Transcript_123258:513-1139(+)
MRAVPGPGHLVGVFAERAQQRVHDADEVPVAYHWRDRSGLPAMVRRVGGATMQRGRDLVEERNRPKERRPVRVDQATVQHEAAKRRPVDPDVLQQGPRRSRPQIRQSSQGGNLIPREQPLHLRCGDIVHLVQQRVRPFELQAVSHLPLAVRLPGLQFRPRHPCREVLLEVWYLVEDHLHLPVVNVQRTKPLLGVDGVQQLHGASAPEL